MERKAGRGPGAIKQINVQSFGLALQTGALPFSVSAVAWLKSADLNLELAISMPFKLGQKNRPIGFGSDPAPKIRHTTTPRRDTNVFNRYQGSG